MEDIKLTVDTAELLFVQTAEELFQRTSASKDSRSKMLLKPLLTRILPWIFTMNNFRYLKPILRTSIVFLVPVTPESSRSDQPMIERLDTPNRWRMSKETFLESRRMSKSLPNENNSLKCILFINSLKYFVL